MAMFVNRVSASLLGQCEFRQRLRSRGKGQGTGAFEKVCGRGVGAGSRVKERGAGNFG
jgi:hypothetical protein